MSAIRASGKLERPAQNDTPEQKGEEGPCYIYEENLIYQWNIDTRSIYHLLRRTFGQCITITEVIDFDVFDIVAIRNIHLTIDCACAIECCGCSRRRRLSACRAEGRLNGRDVDMLNVFLGLDLGIDSGSGSGYRVISTWSYAERTIDTGCSRRINTRLLCAFRRRASRCSSDRTSAASRFCFLLCWRGS